MERRSHWPKGLDEDLRFTEYRLQVVRGLPDGSLRDAVVGAIAARLAALEHASEAGGIPGRSASPRSRDIVSLT